MESTLLFGNFAIAEIVLTLFGLLFLLVLAFAAATETAFLSLSQHEMHSLETSEKNNEQTAWQLAKTPDKILVTLLITKSLATILFAICVAFLPTNFCSISPIWQLATKAILAIVLLLAIEIVSRTIASKHASKIAAKHASKIRFLQTIFRPIAKIYAASTALLDKKTHENFAKNDLSQVLDLAKEASESEKEMLEGIVRFGNVTVANVMTSRLDMTTIEVRNTFEQVLKTIVESGYSRIPIIDNTEDNIRGILFSKDLIPHLTKGNTFEWQTLIRPAFFVPETKKIDDLLHEFQKNRIHIAVVVDEFGGTSGMVTMEDILEEVVGEISDEHDEEEILFQKIDEKNWLFEAKILLNDFEKITDIDLNNFGENAREADTLAGLILELKGEIPQKNETIVYKNYTFEITDADERHIKKVKLSIK